MLSQLNIWEIFMFLVSKFSCTKNKNLFPDSWKKLLQPDDLYSLSGINHVQYDGLTNQNMNTMNHSED